MSIQAPREPNTAASPQRRHLSTAPRPPGPLLLSAEPCHLPGEQPPSLRHISQTVAPLSTISGPTTDTDGDIFHAVGCASFRAGASCASGDRIPVPDGVECPPPHKNVPDVGLTQQR